MTPRLGRTAGSSRQIMEPSIYSTGFDKGSKSSLICTAYTSEETWGARTRCRSLSCWSVASKWSHRPHFDLTELENWVSVASLVPETFGDHQGGYCEGFCSFCEKEPVILVKIKTERVLWRAVRPYINIVHHKCALSSILGASSRHLVPECSTFLVRASENMSLHLQWMLCLF